MFDTFSKILGEPHFYAADKFFNRLPCMDVRLEESLIYFYDDKSLESTIEILRDNSCIEFYTEGRV